MRKDFSSRKGFTLIELIIVIAVIAILATIALFSFNRVQRNARDAKRLGEMKSIQTALEAYNAQMGGYPPTAEVAACLTGAASGCTAGSIALIGAYPNMPRGTWANAPLNGSNANSTTPYVYAGGNGGYTICATLEGPSVTAVSTALTRQRITSIKSGGIQETDATACTATQAE